MPDTIHPDIWRAVESVPVIDTHEHLEEEKTRLERPVIDFTTLFEQYASDDLRSAGLDDETYMICFDPETSLDVKWKLFEPWYRKARNTTYCKAVEIAIKDLYGIDQLTEKSVHELSERIAERNKPGVLKWILRDRCNIDLALVNSIDTTFFREETDESLFRQDLSVAHLLNWPIRIEDLQSDSGVTVKGLDSYGKAIDRLFARFGPKADAIKQQSAYWRPQHFEDVPDIKAAAVLPRVLDDPDTVSEEDRKLIQDWSFHRCIRNAIRFDLPIKIHTGYKVSVNYMRTDDIRPTHLENLFIQYPDAKFDLFHIGYPYQAEVVALAKHYTNVYVDMCWAWIIDPVASREFLAQCLTAIPASKILGFGGDYILAEPVYGHLKIARMNIARVLSALLEDGSLSLAEAVELPSRLLRDNALELFRCRENEQKDTVVRRY